MIGIALFAFLLQGPQQEHPAGPGSLAPRLWGGAEGVVSSWLEPLEGGVALRGAWLREGRWQLLPTPAVESDRLFVNWADTPGIRPLGDGLLAHWLERSAEGTYTYDVRLASSRDGGRTWESLGALHTDRRPAEHGFVSWVDGASGARAFWLDGRATVDADHGEGDHAHGAGPMQLRTAHVSDSVRQEQLLDDAVCDCCPTATAMTDHGPLVAYRDRDPETETRDVAVVRWLGDRWSDPVHPHRDGWVIAGCPVNGPALTARGGEVALAWFTMQPHPRLMGVRSFDGGASWEQATVLFESEGETRAHGRPALAFDTLGRLHVVALGEEGDASGWYHLIVGSEGSVEERRLVVPSGTSRSVGMPSLIALDGGELLLATTVLDGDLTRVRVVEL